MGTVHDQIKGVSGRHADVTTPENIAIVREEFKNHPRQTLKLASQALQISKSSIQVILMKKLLWKPYKTQKRQAIPERCVQTRVHASECFLTAFENDPDMLEAHFESVPPLNRQNNRFWAAVQPYETIETELHPERTTAWGALSSRGSNFFKQPSHQFYFSSLVNSRREFRWILYIAKKPIDRSFQRPPSHLNLIRRSFPRR